MEKGLNLAVDALYVAFGGYPRPASFLACGCCWDGVVVSGTGWNGTKRPIVSVEAPGDSRPLRELTESDLAMVAAEVPLTGGDLPVLKHYLPRMLELLALGGWTNWPDEESVLGSLTFADGERSTPWTEWLPTERAAVATFLRLYELPSDE